ncbi:MAG TPA: hypothetical protein VJV75_01730, partial [Candidatus Polarisedimenticolia bacterium]|nr:hypothetical protein [Candidatus Polarisedimenticolia bacterium]
MPLDREIAVRHQRHHDATRRHPAGDVLHPLRVAPVERVGEPDDGREARHQTPVVLRERPEGAVLAARPAAAVVTRHQRDDLALARREALELGVRQQLVGVLVVPAVADDVADVVQERRRRQEVARSGVESDDRRHLVEDPLRQPAHLRAVIGLEAERTAERLGRRETPLRRRHGARRARHEHPLEERVPDAAPVHPHAVHLEAGHHLVQDRGAGDD